MRIAVLCIGNELLMDEGIGPACGRYLATRYEIPACVDVLDRAVMGLAIISDLRTHDVALVLDAVDVPGGVPGTRYSFEPEDVAGSGQIASLHELRFADVLMAAELTGISCEGHCLGIQAENISPSQYVQALTPRAAAAVPLLAAEAARWLRARTGEPLTDRLAGGDPRRAGQVPPARDARDFSGMPASVGAPEPGEGPSPAGEGADGVRLGPLDVQLPVVYGEPDATVMAGYLRASLDAVGALDVVCGEPDSAWGLPAGGQAVQVGFALPQEGEGNAVAATDALIARFGLREGAGADGARRLYAIVTPEITDYDCDALIGACVDILGGR